MDQWKSLAGTPSGPSLPDRRFTPHYHRDHLGFLDPSRSSQLLGPEDLLGHPAVLIKAQPWMGKTFFAKRMHSWLSGHPDARAASARSTS